MLVAECQCDPPGSGEEYCTGHCVLRAENAQLIRALGLYEREMDDLRAQNDRLKEHLRELVVAARRIIGS